MHRKFLPFPYFMAPAKESAADFTLDQDINKMIGGDGHLSDEPEGDRGDDFDPELFEEEENATRRPVPKETGKEKPAGKGKAGDDEETDDEETDDDAETDDVDKDDDKDDDKAEKPKAKADDKDKADDKAKKPGRAEKRVQQLLERNAALERQLANKTGSETVAKALTELETESARIEGEYHKALSEDPEKAAGLMREMRKLDRKIAQIEASAEAEVAITERLENRDLQTTVSELVEQYPSLDKNSEEFDQEMVNEVNAVYVGLMSTSASKAAAMKKAVKYVMGQATADTTAVGLGDDKGAQKRQERTEQGRKKTVDTINRQPASTANAGKSNASNAVHTIRNIKDLEKVSDEELSKLRGDDI